MGWGRIAHAARWTLPGYDHGGRTHVRNGLGYHARHHLLGTAVRLRGSQLPQRPLGPWPHWVHLPDPVDHRGDFAQQVRTPLTRSRTTRPRSPQRTTAARRSVGHRWDKPTPGSNWQRRTGTAITGLGL